ncbi:hypothetical protein ART_2683 [Arthrobacter sp. PAMC 25486]|uniref:GmrSD restriction endonuclease domain-containing protein n=1 Tax=Arthrobacter sp. PAMC 25486 TaxID=1494608 RepID=UPI000536128B|nr:DUF1524 domain-containing protein [Arthrobacter sp. PAMC 25486]AIY02282.1 hypothetical protein ART_2683 [Arthrobacter sp. PAMC 25486]
MSALRTTRTWGATDFIMASALASVLFMTTACGGVSQAKADPASGLASANTAATSSASAAAPESLSTSPSQTKEPASEPDDAAPLDGDTVPDAGDATLAGVVQPEYAATALNVLATLPIKGRAPKTGYSRAEFGQAWADVDRNGCDTRNDILGRDLGEKTFKPGTRDCVVLTGVLADPYTATTIDFVRGTGTSSAVQIDHVVALSDAWQKGAQQLSPELRTAFGNDPLNLLAVDGPSNQQKGAGDAATWLPPNKSYRCEYVARQISVKASYSLWVTQAEHDAMARVLGDCADIAAPTNQTPPPAAPPAEPVILPPPAPIAPVAPVEAAPQPAPEPAPPVEVPAPAPFVEVPGPEPYYQNCSAVRAAGAAPIHAGEPGFLSKFDGDGDGVGCE